MDRDDDDLREFLISGPFKRLEVSEDVKKRLTDDLKMVLWHRAFRHLTVDGNDNFESTETRGDKMLKSVATAVFMKKAPGRPPLHYSEWDSYYMGNIYLAKLSDELGLPRHLKYRHLSQITGPVKADLFESYCGALALTADMIQVGLGYILVYNTIASLFSGVTLDERRALGSGKTVYIQLLEQMGYRGDGGYSMHIIDGTHRVEVYLTADQHKVIEEFGYRFKRPNEPIGVGEDNSLQMADDLAYTQALDFLYRHDIERDSVAVTKAERNFYRAVGLDTDLVTNAYKKAGEEGYDALGFEMPAKVKTNVTTTAILTGIVGSQKTNLVVRLFKNSEDEYSRKRDADRFRVRVLKTYLGIPDPEDFEDEEKEFKIAEKAERTESGLRLPEGELTEGGKTVVKGRGAKKGPKGTGGTGGTGGKEPEGEVEGEDVNEEEPKSPPRKGREASKLQEVEIKEVEKPESPPKAKKGRRMAKLIVEELPSPKKEEPKEGEEEEAPAPRTKATLQKKATASKTTTGARRGRRVLQ